MNPLSKEAHKVGEVDMKFNMKELLHNVWGAVCAPVLRRLAGGGELGGGPAHRHHHGAGHAEQPPLQVLQDQHDPQAALHHRRPAR